MREPSSGLQLVALVATRFLGGIGFQFFLVGGIDSLFRETSSALVTGLIGAVLFVPSLFAPIVAGRLLARVGKPGQLLVAAQAGVVLTSVVLLCANHKPALVVGAALVFGVLRAISSPLLYALIGELRDSGLESERAARVISLSWQLPLVLGPLIYSVGVALGGREQFPLILSSCNALALLAAGPFLFKKSRPASDGSSFSFTQAVRTFWGHRDVAAPMLADAVLMTLLSFTTLLPFLLSAMARSSSDAGLVRAALNGSSLAVTILAPRTLFNKTRPLTFYVSLVCLTVVTIAFAVTSWFPLMLAWSVVLGAVDGWSILYRNALLMRSVDTRALPSFTSVQQILVSATDDLGELRAGAMGQAFGPRTGMLISAGVASCWSLFLLGRQLHGTRTQTSDVARARVFFARRPHRLDQRSSAHPLDGDCTTVAHDEAPRGALEHTPVRPFGARPELDTTGPRSLGQR